MQMKGNTILITGGGSGIGQALAAAFHGLGNQVIVAGRRQSALEETTAAHPGMRSVVLDVADPAAVRRVSAELVRDFPELNVVILNAGVMMNEDVKRGEVEVAEATVTTNLLGPIRLAAALIPHLLGQSRATILTVSSGLAFVPLALTPTYSATKAAIHAYTQALRYQLQDTSIQVIELIPPYVQTFLQGERQATDPHAMPLDEYITETVALLQGSPDAAEILVGRAGPQRFAERRGEYDDFFKTMNDRLTAARR